MERGSEAPGAHRDAGRADQSVLGRNVRDRAGSGRTAYPEFGSRRRRRPRIDSKRTDRSVSAVTIRRAVGIDSAPVGPGPTASATVGGRPVVHDSTDSRRPTRASWPNSTPRAFSVQTSVGLGPAIELATLATAMAAANGSAHTCAVPSSIRYGARGDGCRMVRCAGLLTPRLGGLPVRLPPVAA